MGKRPPRGRPRCSVTDCAEPVAYLVLWPDTLAFGLGACRRHGSIMVHHYPTAVDSVTEEIIKTPHAVVEELFPFLHPRTGP